MFIVYDLSRLLDIFMGLLKDIPVTSGGLGTQLVGLLKAQRVAGIDSNLHLPLEKLML